MLPDSFHYVIRDWFAQTYGTPTPVQAEAWPLIESGKNVLALAPTGSGKTLTAFLSAISRFCPAHTPQNTPGTQGARIMPSALYPADVISVLYVSPLKALNEDIKRNLLLPLQGIRVCFDKEGLPFPNVRVETRSGDTPQSERRKLFTHPPSILALTPESLAILLLNPKGRDLLSAVKYLILDEIHAVLGNKRGSYLSCQIDRLSSIAGEFQRISLSATIRNPEIAAEFVGGLFNGKGRPVRIVAPQSEKKINFSVEYPRLNPAQGKTLLPEDTARIEKYGERYTTLINYVIRRVKDNSTILVFTESRRRAERLCHFLNAEGVAAFTHHGSLSKELRRGVEKGLADGTILCVVATASLELGIDIGAVDEVILAGSTANVSQALQRVGRSGHSVGRTSRGKLFAFHGMDLLQAAALKSAVDERDIEEIRPVENPLDILAQLILALCVEKNRNIDELFTLLKGFYIFRNLNRNMYDNTVLMLAGLDKKKRLRDIKPRIWLDRTTGEIGAADGALSLLYMSGGVIANRGMYSLRLADGTKIGEVDEEFVWERRIGDCFDFGARGWRIVNIGDESVEIVPLESRADFIPFWRADTVFRSKNLTGRLADILARYNVSGNIESSLEKDAEDSLKSFLDAQKAAQNGLPLPDKNNAVIEITDGVESNKDFLSVVIHTFLGGAVNYPFAIALSGELEEKLGLHVESFSNDNSVILLLPRNSIEGNVENFIAGALDALASDDRGIGCGERLFRNRLEKSGVFGANFREAAERSLLLPKAGFGKRTPLWIMRQRAKRLFDTVADSGEFPVTAEAWRSCLVDVFDMDGFRELLSSIGGSVKLSFFHSARPSPFSEDLVRQEVNSLIYEYDERKDLAGPSTLSDRAIEEALGNAALRPVLKKEIVRGFVSRLRREAPGWAPEDISGLNEWVKERIAIPVDEWETLCHALPEDLKLFVLTDRDSAFALSPLKLTICESTSAASAQSVTRQSLRLMVIKRDGASVASVVHSEWEESWKNEALSLLGPWLRYEGPVSIRRICEVFGVNTAIAEDAVNALAEVDEVVRDVAVEAGYEEINPPYGAGGLISRETAADKENNTAGQALELPPAAIFICDRENLNMLLRVSRKKSRPIIKERPASLLPALLAMRQGIAGNAGPVFKRLGGWTAPVKLWETEILCARNFYSEDLDGEIQKGKLLWYGAGKERAGFCLPEDFELVSNGVLPEQTGIFALIASGFFDRHRDFWEIKNELERVEPCGIKDCAKALWGAVWKGLLSADSFEPVRRGIESGFAIEDDNYAQIPSGENYVLPFGRAPKIPRALRDRWRYGAPVHGAWFSLLEQESGISELEEETLNRDRVRLLIKRWGILCRPLFAYEVPPFSWSCLLPTIRRMELSGELIAGRFFTGINSLQFASPAIAQELEAAESMGGIYWMNATDPASPAGIEIEGISLKSCHRIAANRLYYKGIELIALSGKNNREITIFPDLCEDDLHELITLLKIPRTRKILTEKNILVEKINGQPAAASDYAAFFIQEGFVSDRGRLIFW